VRVDVALTPALLSDVDRSICVVVDVLRASTSCVAMFESGVESIAVAESPELARRIRAEHLPDALLCGETGGLPPPGFDFGNSPAEFSRAKLAGRDAVLVTSNGTRALHAVSRAPSVLVGCLRNRAAVARFATQEAQQSAWAEGRILIVCAANAYGATFSLDDAVTAGAIAQAVERLIAGGPITDEYEPADAALAAVHLYEAYAANLVSAFRDGSHGRLLEQLGFSEDLDFCAAVDASNCVPYLSAEEGGLQMLRARELVP
jgi:2-phosphosulfolactate phosphatase